MAQVGYTRSGAPQGDRRNGLGTNAGERSADMSRELVRLMQRTTGRGPTRARTTMGRDHVLVIFSETLTPGERTLVEGGMSERVATLREGLYRALREEAAAVVERNVERKVVAVMTSHHFEPDYASMLFILDGTQRSTPKIVEASENGGRPEG
jgi:uncharacterized protein YbcI